VGGKQYPSNNVLTFDSYDEAAEYVVKLRKYGYWPGIKGDHKHNIGPFTLTSNHGPISEMDSHGYQKG
jgi:hypothetical protein